MEKSKNKEADVWVKQIVLELKNENREWIYPLSRLQFEEADDRLLQKGFATDGVKVYYHPKYILEHKKSELKMQLLHILLHGLLGHFESKDEYGQKAYRNFMMDVQVEYVLSRMNKQDSLSYAESVRQKSKWKKLDRYVQGDYSIGIYRRLCEKTILSSVVDYYNLQIQRDDHEMWDKGDRQVCMALWISIREEMLEEGEKEGEGNVTKERLDHLADRMNIAETEWKSVGEESIFEAGMGKRIDYKELLKNLVCFRERSAETPDSIDYMLYQYGMELYEDIPLIEPAEESIQVYTIAIAVDVSGSCVSEAQMKVFWGETNECLQYLKEKSRESEVFLFQCDDEIRKEQRIRIKEWDNASNMISVNGGGATSFVPVIDRLTQIEQSGQKIDALFYLTDGIGIYPKKAPSYPVYFILEEDETDGYDMIPEWIKTVYL